MDSVLLVVFVTEKQACVSAEELLALECKYPEGPMVFKVHSVELAVEVVVLVVELPWVDPTAWEVLLAQAEEEIMVDSAVVDADGIQRRVVRLPQLQVAHSR